MVMVLLVRGWYPSEGPGCPVTITATHSSSDRIRCNKTLALYPHTVDFYVVQQAAI